MLTRRFDWAQTIQRRFRRLLRALGLMDRICLHFEFLNVPWDNLNCDLSLIVRCFHMSLNVSPPFRTRFWKVKGMLRLHQ